MKSQFIHISLYGRKRRPGGKRHETAIGILNEAARQPTATTHILTPSPPRQMIGMTPLQVGSEVKKLATLARDSRGRKLRSDAHLIMCLVLSFPDLMNSSENEAQRYEHWVRLTLQWLTDQFGQQLSGAVEHIDESYRHIHAFVLPAVALDGQLEWGQIHPGRSAKKSAALAGASKRDQDDAYVAAMKSLQDDFHQAVSQHFGHARVSVQRPRRMRSEHLLIRNLEAENHHLAAIVADLKHRMAAPSAKHSPHASGAGTLIGEFEGAAVGSHYDAEEDADAASPDSNVDENDDFGPTDSSNEDNFDFDSGPGDLSEGSDAHPDDEPGLED